MSRQIHERQRGTRQKEKLTVQQRLFVKYMLASESMKPTEAAEKAGYKNPSQAAHKLMKRPIIRASLGKEIADRSQRVQKSADDILRILHEALSVDVTEIFDDQGYTTIAKLKELPSYVRQCIQSIDTDIKTVGSGEDSYVQEVIKVKWISKDHALELAMKHHGLLAPDLHVHVVTDKMKAQLLIELLHEMSHGSVIDADHIKRIAESDDQPKMVDGNIV